MRMARSSLDPVPQCRPFGGIGSSAERNVNFYDSRVFIRFVQKGVKCLLSGLRCGNVEIISEIGHEKRRMLFAILVRENTEHKRRSRFAQKQLFDRNDE